ncbi:MAG: amidohydrolase family protein, partial [Cyclobacteriaceae bacterium]|nr:amidohydrolase family protein [Cyclobacteriaceae bacterium]
VIDGRIDVIATDHAPHTWEEKQGKYFSCPSGGPLVQHSVTAMFELYKQGKITLEMMVKKMSHDPAVLFQIQDRGFVREGYFADLAIIDPNSPWTVSKENILAKCGWSPFDGTTFSSRVETTFVSGHLAWHEGKFNEKEKGHRLLFNR